eukprot:11165319-Lingulodinium_polyedra.AAC.1
MHASAAPEVPQSAPTGSRRRRATVGPFSATRPSRLPPPRRPPSARSPRAAAALNSPICGRPRLASAT